LFCVAVWGVAWGTQGCSVGVGRRLFKWGLASVLAGEIFVVKEYLHLLCR
jgi:hypothetical protein